MFLLTIWRALYLKGINLIHLKTVHMMEILVCAVSLCQKLRWVSETSPPPPPPNSQGDDLELPSSIYRMVIFMGYGSGLLLGWLLGTFWPRGITNGFSRPLEGGRKLKTGGRKWSKEETKYASNFYYYVLFTHVCAIRFPKVTFKSSVIYKFSIHGCW